VDVEADVALVLVERPIGGTGPAIPDRRQQGRHQQHLVGVDHDRVCTLDTGDEMAVRGGEGGDRAVGPVDVEPQIVFGGVVCDRVEGIECAGRRRTGAP
jgi:hypothetical protein